MALGFDRLSPVGRAGGHQASLGLDVVELSPPEDAGRAAACDPGGKAEPLGRRQEPQGPQGLAGAQAARQEGAGRGLGRPETGQKGQRERIRADQEEFEGQEGEAVLDQACRVAEGAADADGPRPTGQMPEMLAAAGDIRDGVDDGVGASSFASRMDSPARNRRPNGRRGCGTPARLEGRRRTHHAGPIAKRIEGRAEGVGQKFALMERASVPQGRACRGLVEGVTRPAEGRRRGGHAAQEIGAARMSSPTSSRSYWRRDSVRHVVDLRVSTDAALGDGSHHVRAGKSLRARDHGPTGSRGLGRTGVVAG